jgi:predicted transposase YbfD/YdcC
MGMLAGLPDTRRRQGRRHRLEVILTVVPAGLLAGAKNLRGIGQWAQTVEGDLAETVGLTRRRPVESTIRRTLAKLDPGLLDWLSGAWTRIRAGQAAGRTVISFDGKTVRGAKAAGQHAPHLVAGLRHGDDVIIAQTEVDAKTNEIPAHRELLKRLVITGCLIIADALHGQTETAQQIIDQKAHYLFTIKGNQPTLRRMCAIPPWSGAPSKRFHDRSHGRRITRTITVLTPTPGSIDFPGVAQVARLTRTITVKGKKTKETVYLICSLECHEASPEQIATWIRQHWAIEVRIHHVRDVTFGEDASTCRTGNLPRLMASFRNLAINLIRLAGHKYIPDGLRLHSWRPQTLIQLLQTTPA